MPITVYESFVSQFLGTYAQSKARQIAVDRWEGTSVQNPFFPTSFFFRRIHTPLREGNGENYVTAKCSRPPSVIV